MDLDFQEFVEALKDFTNGYVKEAVFLQLWRDLNTDNTSTVQELWACRDGNLLLPMIAVYLNCDVADMCQELCGMIEVAMRNVNVSNLFAALIAAQ